MAAQPDISAILAALNASKAAGTPTPGAQSTPQPQQAGYPGVVSAATPSNPAAGLALPQPSNSGSLDLSSIKSANAANVSLADAIAKARTMKEDKASDPRRAGRSSHNKRSPTRSRSPQRRENARDNYNPYRDERRDDSRRNGRDRSASPAGARQGAQPPATRDYRSPAAGDNNTEIITVDSSSVGLIIGRAGENLRRVESETGARVQFVSNADNPGPLRQCRISGTPRQRSEAKKDIFRVVEEHRNNGRDSALGNKSQNQNQNQSQSQSSSNNGSQQPPLREGERSSQIMVPDRTVGLIIGRGGETIRDLQERSGCHVNIVGENKSVNGLRPVNLIGTREAAKKAQDLILEIVESDTRVGGTPAPQIMQPMMAAPPPAAYGRPPYDPYAAAYAAPPYDDGQRITDMMTVPSEAVGMIIGKGGETIKDMQNTTACKINVSPPSGPDVTRGIGLIGTRTAIENAKRQIWDKVGTVREKQGGQIRGDPVAYDPYAPQQPPPYGQPPGPMPPAHAMPPPVDQGDPYAAYGGYQNYMAMWYAAVANQGGPPGGPPPQ